MGYITSNMMWVFQEWLVPAMAWQVLEFRGKPQIQPPWSPCQGRVKVLGANTKVCSDLHRGLDGSIL